MEKRLIPMPVDSSPAVWMDLPAMVDVEVTSEHSDFPIENIFKVESSSGWMAATPGQQLIRLCFHRPQTLRIIHLVFEDLHNVRTQEFVLSAISCGKATEIQRQQFNFNAPLSTVESETYNVHLDAVTTLELRITPDIRSGGLASLKTLMLA